MLQLYEIVRKFIITIYFWLVVVMCNIVAIIIIIPSWLVGLPAKQIRYQIEFLIGKITSVLMESLGIWTITYIDNRKNNRVDDNQSYVIISNHKSLIDTIFTAQISYDKVYTWKKKWSYVPGFGQLCLLGNHITIDTSNPNSKKNAVDVSVEFLEEGTSVMFYPEGTRNNTSDILLPFKTGAFRVAAKSNKKILPVTLVGTKNACNGFVCDAADIKIIIDDPIEVGTGPNKSISDCIEKIRSVMRVNINNY